MIVIDTVRGMTELALAKRAEGSTIGFVPTMGYFHKGHLDLMRLARKKADLVVISIFVNPTQFGANEDLSKYPRDFERDHRLAEAVGVDVIFYPSPEEMYPPGFQTSVALAELSQHLCGKSRPMHFGGVATVCCKLFNIVRPHFAVFGEKDYQQLLVVTRMAADLNLDLEIIPGPTGRESDGLAMSSRNVYLNPAQRKQATALIESIRLAREMVDGGETGRDAVLAAVRRNIDDRPLAKIDYTELRTLPDLAEAPETLRGEHLLALAVNFGKTRLIDNTVLNFTP